MKLQLKHIAPYLPYKLFGKVYGKNTIDKLLGIYGTDGHTLTMSYRVNNHNTVDYDCNINEFKPILRPLSDLTKEIEVNGENFVPIEKVQDWNTSIDFAKEFEALLEDERWLSTTSYLLVELLFEWHFDVFGLIEEGLAIDINTLEL